MILRSKPFSLTNMRFSVYHADADDDTGGYQYDGETTEIDYDAVLDTCDDWNTASNDLENAADDFMDNFQAISFLAGDYMEMIKDSLNDMAAASKSLVDGVKTFAEYLKNQDDDSNSPIIPPITDVVSGGGGSSNNNDNNNNFDSLVPGQSDKDVISPEQKEDLDKLTFEIEDTYGLVDSLKDLASEKDVYMDELLEDKEFADDLKELLLKSPYLSDTTIKELEDVDSDVLRLLLKDIMSGNRPELFNINPLNLGVVYTYLKSIANENNITIEELLNKDKYSDLLRDALSNFEDVAKFLDEIKDLSSEEYQATLLKIYDGDGIGDMTDSTVGIIREYIDYLSTESEISVEELLTDTKYADVLKTAGEEFKDSVTFMAAAANYSEEGMTDIVGGMLQGKNARAFGMDNDELVKFKQEIEEIAKDNGTTLNKFLSDSKYADYAKDALVSSKYTEDVGRIYKDDDASVSQNVIKNLCDQIVEKSDTDDQKINISEQETDSNSDQMIFRKE